MKNILRIVNLTCILLLCSINISEPAPKLQILFVGNSYTYQNGLPQMLEDMLKAAGISAQVDAQTGPGWALQQHAKATRTIRKIRSQNWDFVILQEQSLIPALSQYRESQMIPAVSALTEMHQGSTILFMTWGRRDGLKSSGFNRFHDMQNALTEGYIYAARHNDVAVAPAGEAFRAVLKQKPFYPLWASDGSHPSYQGSYLTACVIFQTITQRSPVGNTFKAKISENARLFLQKAAETTVSSQRW